MGAAARPLAPAPALDELRHVVRARLESAAVALHARGVPVPELRGKLLRPTLAYAFVPPAERAGLDDRFWMGALAVQMVHEASLLHDDIIDGAAERRGDATVVARAGVGPALVLGDHYLTGAYRAAAATGSSLFLDRFIVAVERTVAGEVRQGASAGQRLDMGTYVETILGKSGELMGAAACLGPALLGREDVDAAVSTGRQIGALYQQVDDLLDYCGVAATGKPPFQDYRQGKWTWVLGIAELEAFGRDEAAVARAMFAPVGDEPPVAERALLFLRTRGEGVCRDAERIIGGDDLVRRIVGEWLSLAREAVTEQVRVTAAAASAHAELADAPGDGPAGEPGGPLAPRLRAGPEAVVAAAAAQVGGPDRWGAYFAHHARTFSRAARLFPAEHRRPVEGLYAYCRFTDDLVDEATDADPAEVEERLAAWSTLSHAAWGGTETGIELLDEVMTAARAAGVSWRYPAALLDGVGMDLRIARYPTWSELERYTFGVAGAVGGWMTQLFGIHDPDTLDRAHALGHAMQLTNIVRDVGEDLERDRLYLPAELLDDHGLTVEQLDELRRSGAAIPTAYAHALEETMARADAYYTHARPGLRVLPAFFRRPAAAAAEAYRGIHREVRRNGYDNLRLRAHTTPVAKAVLGAWGVLRAAVPFPSAPRGGERYAT